jgi:hypothetical protein
MILIVVFRTFRSLFLRLLLVVGGVLVLRLLGLGEPFLASVERVVLVHEGLHHLLNGVAL